MLRASDEQPIRVVRQIPLWGVITMVVTAATFAIATSINQFYGQQRLIEQVAELTTQIKSLTIEVNGKNLKDIEHDIKIADIVRRVSILEAASAKHQ